MPVKDRVDLTKQTIESLFKNTKHPFKLTIISDNSDEDTTKYLETLMIRSDWPIRTILMKDSKGPGAIRNTGMSVVDDSEFYYHTDNDIYFLEGWLTKMLKAMDDFPKVGILGGRTHPHHHFLEVKENNNSRIKTCNQQYGYSLLIRKQVWKDAGPFFFYKMPEGIGKEDVKFCDRAKDAGWEIAHMEPNTILHCGMKNTFGLDTHGHDLESSQKFPEGVITA